MTPWGSGALLPLRPAGVGTVLVEGLSSYVVRLAVAHVVPTRLLVVELFPRSLGCLSRDAMLGRRGAWLNGMGTTARGVAVALEGLTLQPGLDRLTLWALRRVLPPGRVLSLRRRWCPSCYGEMRRERAECWDPLLWFLAPVLWCPLHRRPLRDACARCGRAQPWLARDTSLGWCAWCGHDLARRGGATALVGDGAVSGWPGRDARWEARVCADIAAAIGRGAPPVDPAQLTRKVVALAKRHDGGNSFAFARRLGVPLDTPRHWMHSGRPRLDHLLLMGRRLGLHPCSLLFEEFTTGSALAKR